MRVTFNSISDTLLGRLQSLGAQQNKALVELSSGQRISAPSDDAPAMQRVLNLRTEKKQNQQFYRNATDGLEKSQVTFSTLQQLKDLLVRSSELSANISGASSEQEYKAKAAEIDQLIQQGLNLGNTKLRGSFLFSGESTLQIPFQAEQAADGKITSVAYKGSDNEAFMHVGEGSEMTISASTSASENRSMADIINEMIRLRDAMSSFDSQAVSDIRTGGGTFGQTDAGTLINLPPNHALKVGDKITTSAGGLMDDGRQYYVLSLDSQNNTIELSETPGGPAVNVTDIAAGSTFQRVGGLQEMEDTILSTLSRQGTIQYRLETVMKDLEKRYEQSERLISVDADVDFADASVRLNRAQLAYEAAIQSGARIQNTSLLDYVR